VLTKLANLFVVFNANAALAYIELFVGFSGSSVTPHGEASVSPDFFKLCFLRAQRLDRDIRLCDEQERPSTTQALWSHTRELSDDSKVSVGSVVNGRIADDPVECFA
jgi:hypothetical protein